MSHDVSAGQCHGVQLSTVAAPSYVCLSMCLSMCLLLCDHTATITRTEVVLFCELVHFKPDLWCINVKMQ